MRDDHLSSPAVTSRFKRPAYRPDGQPYSLYLGLAPDGVYRPAFVTKDTVVSYTAFPPSPENFWLFISVALSLESPPPDVIWHPALWSPDFPHLLPFGNCSRDHPHHSTLFNLLYLLIIL